MKHLFAAFLLLAAPSAAFAQACTVITAPPLVNTVPPVVTGTPQQGSVLTVSNGTWTLGGAAFTPTSFTYSWTSSAGGASLGTAQTYTLQASDVGNTISASVTAFNGVVASTPTAPVCR